MSLTILNTDEERLLGSVATDAVTECLARGTGHHAGRGAATLLVPSFAQALQVQKQLAEQGISLGVQVTTPSAWMRDQWDLWGDGRRVVDAATRTLLMHEVLRIASAKGDAWEATPGMVHLLCSLAERGLPFMAEALEAYGSALTPQERRAATMVEEYGELLHARGFVEGGECACKLPQRLADVGVRPADLVMLGFDELRRHERVLVRECARLGNVTFVLRAGNEHAAACARRTAEQLQAEIAHAGGEVWARNASGSANAHEPVRASELRSLCRDLFFATDGKVESEGAVGLLQPSGPLAEAELIARSLASAADGAKEMLVVSPQVRKTWYELAPKLVKRGLAVRATISVPTLQTRSGRAFLGFARTVAQLHELASFWPAPREEQDGTYVRLGSMDWWPPRELSDFLLSDLARVARHRAYALDAIWRSNRLLTPQDVLDQLLSESSTSTVVAQATRELLKGRLGSAASKFLAPLAQDVPGSADEATTLAREEAVGVLAKVLGVAGTLKDLGVTANPEARDSVSLGTLVDKAELALADTSVTLRVRAGVTDAVGRVTLASRSQAAALEPGAFHTVVVCGLTSQDYGVPSGDDELQGMLEALRIEPSRDGLAAQRASFYRICSAASEKLLLERCLFTADSKETYPAVMLTEVLTSYADAERLPRWGLPEDAACANLSSRGLAPALVDEDEVAPAGHISPALRHLVTVPQAGRPETPGELPVLSASQLESYLECPLKWFSLRRLRLRDNDAGFGGLEMGTFAHRVLELTYTRLYEEGAARPDWRDPDSVAHAHEVLDECFRENLDHQFVRSRARLQSQALVAHTSAEESAIDRLHRDLLTSVDYAAKRFVGFEPKAFEWSFGGGRNENPGDLPVVSEATYAGVRVMGTVDRIDVNGHGQAIVLDYKHKSPTGFFGEYAVFSKDRELGGDLVLPRRIQALLYAQVVRRAFPDLNVVGALYLATKGDHDLSGAVDASFADAAFGGMLGAGREQCVAVGTGETFSGVEGTGFSALLDATEQAIAVKVERLREGHVEADPIDAEACSFCPVANCERRLEG